MAKNFNKVKIDRDKLAAILKAYGLSNTEVSRKMGFSDSYISACKNSGEMSKAGAILLERIYGIKEEAYTITEESKEELAKAPETGAESNSGGYTLEDIEQAAYRGALRAVRELLN